MLILRNHRTATAPSIRFRGLAFLLRHKPWPVTSVVAGNIAPGCLIEEERTPFYSEVTFYPAKLGEIVDTYQLVAKLGFGTCSTVWLARDLRRYKWQDERYVTIKICSAPSGRYLDTGKNELEISHRIRGGTLLEEPSKVRILNDFFFLDGPNLSQHCCLVFEPMRESLCIFRQRFAGGVFPRFLIKSIVRQVLEALAHLHENCRVVHTDLKLDNILVEAENKSIFRRVALEEYHSPLRQKQCKDGRRIYLSRNDLGMPQELLWLVQLGDFSHSVRGEQTNFGAIQAPVYQAPEVVIEADYSYSADIWNLGVLLWDLIEGRNLLGTNNSAQANSQHAEHVHLAHIAALLGPAPKSLLDKGRRTFIFYEPDYTLKDRAFVPNNFKSFGESITCMTGTEKALFLLFVSRMLKWDPAERSTARALLDDPWLCYNDN